MNKKRNKRLVSICIVILVIILGGVITMNLFNQEEVNKEHREQERMVKYIVSHYDGIKKVEFCSFNKNRKTGAIESDAKINDKIFVYFTVWENDNDITMSEFSSRNNGNQLHKNIKKGTDIDISGIKVTYWKEK